MRAKMVKMPSKYTDMNEDELSYDGGSNWSQILSTVAITAVIGGLAIGLSAPLFSKALRPAIAGTGLSIFGVGTVTGVVAGIKEDN